VAGPVLALVASRFGLYPYGEVRLLLFAIPGALALLAAGVATAIERRQWVGVLVAGLFGASFAFQGAVRETYDSTYLHTYDARPAQEALAALWQPGDRIVATPSFLAQLAHYRPELAAAASSSEEPRGPDAGALRPVGRRGLPAARPGPA